MNLEDIARKFHDEYERLAPEYGYETKPESRVSWDDLDGNHKALMIATVRAATRDILDRSEKLHKALELAANIIEHANSGAFDNGVVHSGMDEGETVACRALGEFRELL